jgi:hypothetical protein
MFFKSNQAHFSPDTTLKSTPRINHNDPISTIYTDVYISFKSSFANRRFNQKNILRPFVNQIWFDPGGSFLSSSDRAVDSLQYQTLRTSTQIYLEFRSRADFSFSNNTNSYRAHTYPTSTYLGFRFPSSSAPIPTLPIPSEPRISRPKSSVLLTAPYFTAKIFTYLIMAPKLTAEITEDKSSISLLTQDSSFPTYTQVVTFYLPQAENLYQMFALEVTSEITDNIDTYPSVFLFWVSQFYQNFGTIFPTFKVIMVSYSKKNSSSKASSSKKKPVSAKAQKTAARKKAQAFKASLLNKIEMEEIEQLQLVKYDNSPHSLPSKHTTKKSKSSPSFQHQI